MRTAIFIFPFLIFCLLEANPAVCQEEDEANLVEEVWCDDKVINSIKKQLKDLNKKVDILEVLNKKMDSLDAKLRAMTAEKPNSKLNLEEIVAKKVKDFHTQMTMEMVKQTVKNQQDILAQQKSLNESIIEQLEGPKIQLKTLKNIIEDWKSESTKVANDTLKKVEAMVDTETLSNQDLHSSIKNDLNDIKSAMQRNSEESEWIKNYFQILNSTIEVNEQQVSALNIDIHKNLENQYLVQQQILKYLEDNIPKMSTLSKPDLDTEIIANETSGETVNNTDFLIPVYNNCGSALENTSVSGVYRLSIPHMEPFDAYCLNDEINGSNWTIIQRRQDGSVDFYRDWQDYKNGFGNPEGEYWLGLEKIYAMTSKQTHELWIEFVDWEGEKRSAHYSLFEIGNEDEKYYLKKVGKFSGTAGDILGPADKKSRFSTRDADNDESSINCAKKFHSPWWYNYCFHLDLNGIYNYPEGSLCERMISSLNDFISVSYIHLAIRPVK